MAIYLFSLMFFKYIILLKEGILISEIFFFYWSVKGVLEDDEVVFVGPLWFVQGIKPWYFMYHFEEMCYANLLSWRSNLHIGDQILWMADW